MVENITVLMTMTVIIMWILESQSPKPSIIMN